MPVTPTYPGVYIEEIPSGVRAITGVATSITAFVGRARRGPLNEPVTINSYSDFERIFGGLWEQSSLGYAVRDFYLNGGSQAIIVRLFHPSYSDADQAKALVAAQAVETAAKNAATPNATPGAVKTAARQAANGFANDPEKTAADIVAKAAEAAAGGPPVTTATAVAKSARDKASDPANSAEPSKSAGDLVATGAETAAAQNGSTPLTTRDAAKTAATAVTTASDDVAKAAATAAGQPNPTANSVKTAARAKANDPANANDPRKTVADLTAKAAEDAAALQGATPDTVKDAARAAADAIKAVADDVSKVAETEAAKWAGAVRDAASAAVGVAAPLTRAQIAKDTLNLQAANEGSWGNQLRIRVDYLVKNNDPNLFNLSVLDTGSGTLEVFRNLSCAAADTRNAEKVLGNESKLVRVRGALPAARPAAHGDPQPGQNPFADNAANCHSRVLSAGQASDGSAIVKDDFTGAGKESSKQGLFALEKADLYNLLCIPPYTDDGDVQSALWGEAAAYCEKRRAMLLVDSPVGWVDKDKAKQEIQNLGTNSKNAAVFFPRLRQPNPLREDQKENFAPCGAVAGVFARTDTTRGVWKAPAGLDATMVGVPELNVPLTDAENGELNPLGINCLRAMPPAGRVVWGARTLQGDDRLASEWKYIPIRRTALFLEESLYRGTQWVVFEPNDEPLWGQIRLNLGAFMNGLFRQGAFQGKTPAEAYFVKCDKETTTQTDRDLGRVNIVVGFAPLKPAEFVIIKIQQMAGQIQT